MANETSAGAAGASEGVTEPSANNGFHLDQLIQNH